MPPVLSRPSKRHLGLAILCLVLLALPFSASPAAAWSGGTFSAADEQQLLSLTNGDRAAAGLPALVDDAYLHGKARWRAQDMGDRDYFSHQIPPSGELVFVSMRTDGYCYQLAGENIGLSTFDDATATTNIEAGFMGSPTHRDNIMGNWSRIGVGAYEATDGRKLYAVLFSIPCPLPATPSPTVEPSASPSPPPTPEPTASQVLSSPPVISQPTAHPAPATPRPTAGPTIRPTPRLTASPSPSPALPPVASPTSAPSPTFAPTPAPTVSSKPPTTPPEVSSLRVRPQRPSDTGPLSNWINLLFGGLLGR